MGATTATSPSDANCRGQVAQPSSPNHGNMGVALNRDGGLVLRKLSSTSRACAHLEQLHRLERLESPITPAQLLRAPAKMPAGAALAQKSCGNPACRTQAGNYTKERIHVPQCNNAEMTELMDALKVANNLHKEGAISSATYAEMCDGIQRKMDNLVCLWVPSGN
uniref:Uncharacterized protein n=1 Tax=Tetraselmis chuii TaxID=63592 RepID=A0A7S1X3N9_9CHLO|mmetsp:Transcript_25216/g.44978  ORF Transcript_25216/g.44978 Transcript_25216/m.44978 type:complete len:165 (+) Transcript_25216:268-762(+)|eukprot:CAMPEP_0177753120 /NCGR_PEP_ID=MMETSP0491_2-20121128/1284_1 /TAXON_ID=63592 /ORGANISM="Tetraselmis chuii, Strain PLY429" /LENGTH=164 /DNA_ID=CAMNT_0019268371 /DNA_START=262 /DNA_END=756 /DNA_ORIENTATION=-